MKNRLITSAVFLFVIAIAFILKIFVSNYFFDALILIVACFSAYETSKLFTKMGRYNNKIIAMLFPFVLMLSFLLGIAFDSSIGILFTIVISIGLIALFFCITFIVSILQRHKTSTEIKVRKIDKQISKSKYSIVKALNTTVIFVYPTFLFMLLTFINHFEDLSSSFNKIIGFNGWLSFFVLIFTLLIPIFTDTFAYLTGGLFGGKKLAPKISPNKTISGAIGGTVWCVLLSIVVYYIFSSIPVMSECLFDAGITVWKILIISILGSILSQIGDLFESWLKRSAGVKDAGNILPGHGGMLDRFDSYMFVIPFVFIAFSILFAVI